MQADFRCVRLEKAGSTHMLAAQTCIRAQPEFLVSSRLVLLLKQPGAVQPRQEAGSAQAVSRAGHHRHGPRPPTAQRFVCC